MKMTIRWFGKLDSIPLSFIKQIPGVSGVVTSLMDIPVGEVWEMDQVQKLGEVCKGANLECEVIESVNIHEDIKLGLPNRDKYIENYAETMKNLHNIGIKVICYNFMPVLDWARSTLFYDLPDSSSTMYFDNDVVMNITLDELAAMYRKESYRYEMPGWEPERMKKVNETIAQYGGMTEEKYWENIKYFLDAIIPFAEKYDIKMAIHPDDPPWPIFGLPRLITCRNNIRRFLDLNKSPYNGITLCTGSLGANSANDIPALVKEFSKEGRIHFAHIRNLKFESEKSFYESAHYEKAGSLPIFDIVEAFYDAGFDGYIRPDHGRMIWGEINRAGYGLYDRALGSQYLLGIWNALERLKK
ncbi:MAG: mannonate dehydratase [Oscillospiraceae bacterium]|nr:mannonate dehydratase [Oscillospiraceae bacterium]